MKTTIDHVKLTKLLASIGKGTFIACFDVIKNNYNGDRNAIKEAITQYALKTTGKEYTYTSLTTKSTCSCTIFKNGWEIEALRICGIKIPEEPVKIVSHEPTAVQRKANQSQTASSAKKPKKRPSRAVDRTVFTANKKVITNIYRMFDKIGKIVDREARKYGTLNANFKRAKAINLDQENHKLKKQIAELKAELERLKESA